MARITEINEQVIGAAKLALKGLGFSRLSIKLKAISALENNSISKVSEVFDITRNTLKSWVKAFSSEGISGLEAKPKKTKTHKLNSLQKEWLIGLVKDYKKNWNLEQLRAEILRVHGVEVSTTTISRTLKRLGFSYITPRPQHYKQKPEELQKFKKKSTGKHKK